MAWCGPAGLGAAVPITKPRGYGVPTPTPKLPAEGSMVISKRCHIEPDGKSGWFLVVFEKEPGSLRRISRWALPCALLTRMEMVTRSKPGAIFRISGENTIYDGRCFILLQKAALELEPPPPEDKAPTEANKTTAATSRPAEATTGPSTRPATTGPVAAGGAATAPAATAPTADEVLAALREDQLGKPRAADASKEPAGSDEVLKALRRDKLGKPVLPTVRAKTRRPNEPSVAPLPKAKVLSPGRGWTVVDRLVTVAPPKRGQWMQIRFESDNTLREPPMQLLPCSILRRAELVAAAAEKGKTVRLRISGVVTFYRGKRFLLLRKALVERNMGRF